MALIVNTPNPKDLLASIRKAIDESKVETWSYDQDGDFTHTPNQWIYQAWLRPVVVPGALIFGLVGKKDVQMTKVVYGVYHGRFTEMLLTHFDDDFSAANATAQKDANVDSFK
jgi:hypothetical protein